MVIIHDHACSTTVKLYGIYDSIKMSRSSSTTTRGDRLCDPSRAEQRGGADAAQGGLTRRDLGYRGASAQSPISARRRRIFF